MSLRLWSLLKLAPLMSAAAEVLAPGGGGGGGTPTPTGTGTTPTPTPTPGVVDTKWLGEGADPTLVGYVQNKGWKDPRELLDGYRNLEKLVGEQRIALPKDEKDEAAWGKLYDSMGRPKTAEEYKLPVPEGGDPALAKHFSGVFHKAGLSAKQATAVTNEWNAITAKAAKDEQTARETKQGQEMDAVKAEWGGAYDERVAVGQRAMRTFGIDTDVATKLEAAMGSKWLMDFSFRIGHALTEHKGEGMEGGGPKAGALTPQQAIAEIERLKKDVEWGKKYTGGDVEARARMEQLHKWAYPT